MNPHFKNAFLLLVKILIMPQALLTGPFFYKVYILLTSWKSPPLFKTCLAPCSLLIALITVLRSFVFIIRLWVSVEKIPIALYIPGPPSLLRALPLPSSPEYPEPCLVPTDLVFRENFLAFSQTPYSSRLVYICCLSLYVEILSVFVCIQYSE